MADSILNIVIRARDETQAAFVAIQQQLKNIQESLKSVDAAGVGKEATSGINALGATANTVSKQVDDLASHIKALQVNLDGLGTLGRRIVGVFAGFFSIAYIKSLADGAARTQVLGTVLTQVASNAGITADEIAKVDKGVQALGITAEASRQSLSQFIQSGLDITKAVTLARAAQDLAVVAGRDSSQTFEGLIANIQKMNTVGLRFMGIIVDMESAVQKYAAANGVAAESVSRATKQQILLDETLEQSLKLQGLYEASMTNVGKQLSSLARYQKEAADSAGEILLPAYLVLVQEFTLFLKQVTLSSEAMNKTSEAGITLAQALRPVASTLREIAVFVKTNIVAMLELAAVMYVVIKASALQALAMKVLTGVLTFVAGATSNLILVWRGLGIAFAANPFGVVLIGVGLLITAVTALYNIFKDKTPEDAAGKLKVGYQVLIDLTEKQLDAERALQDAQEGRGDKTVQQAQEELDAIKEQKKAVIEKNEELEKGLRKRDATKEQIHDEAEAQAKVAGEFKKTRQAIDDVNEKLVKMGVFGESARKGLDISAGFDEQVSNFKNMEDAFKEGLKNINGEAVVTQGQMDTVARKIATGAKTADEMRKAIELLGASGSLSRDQLLPLLRALELKAAKQGIEEAQKALGNFMETAKAAGSSLTVLDSIADTLRSSSSELSKELAKIGAAADAQGEGIDALTGKLQVSAQSQQALAKAEQQAFEDTAKAAENRYAREIAQLEATKAARIQAADSIVGNERGRQAAILNAEKEFAAAAVDVAKAKFDTFVKLQADYLRSAIATANEIKKIDEALYESKRTLEEKLFNLSQKGKSEEEQQAAIREQILKRGSEAEAARLQGNFDLAKKLNDQRIALVDKLAVPENASEEQKVAIADELKKAYGQQSAILTDQKTIKEESLKTEIEGYNKTLGKIKEITAELAQFVDEQVVKLSVQLDTGSLDTVVNQIKDALNDITINLKIKTEKFASGGLVTGPGTGKSDSILAALSNREFVMNSDAVSRYGVNFMEAVNSMSFPMIPRFAAGGLVGIPAANDSVAPGGSRETVNVNLNVGGQKVSLMGERAQVRKLVGAFKNLEGV